jgi:hypothetical protein
MAINAQLLQDFLLDTVTVHICSVHLRMLQVPYHEVSGHQEISYVRKLLRISGSLTAEETRPAIPMIWSATTSAPFNGFLHMQYIHFATHTPRMGPSSEHIKQLFLIADTSEDMVFSMDIGWYTRAKIEATLCIYSPVSHLQVTSFLQVGCPVPRHEICLGDLDCSITLFQ